jgi:ribosome-binding factor A
MPREFSRHLRVGAELQRVLNELLQFEVKDPRLKDIRVTAVEVSGDLAVARVFYSPLEPDSESNDAAAAMAKAGAFLRSRAGRELRLRRMPELRFKADLSAREGFRISKLIDQATGQKDTKRRMGS